MFQYLAVLDNYVLIGPWAEVSSKHLTRGYLKKRKTSHPQLRSITDRSNCHIFQ